MTKHAETAFPASHLKAFLLTIALFNDGSDVLTSVNRGALPPHFICALP